MIYITPDKSYRIYVKYEIQEIIDIHIILYIFDENQTLLFYSDDIYKNQKPVLGQGSVSFIIPSSIFQFREKYIISLSLWTPTDGFLINPYNNTVSIGINVQKKEKSPITHLW